MNTKVGAGLTCLLGSKGPFAGGFMLRRSTGLSREIKNFRGRKTTVTMTEEMEELHQLLLTIVLPELSEIKSRIDNLEKMHNHLNRRCDRVQADLCEFYRILGSHDAKIDRLEKAGNQRD
jgi:hypothetical protein